MSNFHLGRRSDDREKEKVFKTLIKIDENSIIDAFDIKKIEKGFCFDKQERNPDSPIVYYIDILKHSSPNHIRLEFMTEEVRDDHLVGLETRLKSAGIKII